MTGRRFLLGWECEGESDKKEGLEKDPKKLLEIIETKILFTVYI